ncbi:DUF1010 domain-containing protein [Ectopseudomonas oleovorans]|uniref:DUF1010 domain-containing protein n=1 Tax=Ectopseudomonas oleovorans TaxID=301 RepID=UPI00373AE75A
MNIQAPLTLASFFSLGVWRSHGLRLWGFFPFQAFLSSSAFTASARCYGFHIMWPMRSRSLFSIERLKPPAFSR